MKMSMCVISPSCFSFLVLISLLPFCVFVLCLDLSVVGSYSKCSIYCICFVTSILVILCFCLLSCSAKITAQFLLMSTSIPLCLHLDPLSHLHAVCLNRHDIMRHEATEKAETPSTGGDGEKGRTLT